ncbi:MAG TPA: hypothetical protein VFS10_07900 [Pyrinomonadaceae bacterium]|nr:hypothetical protein [Pyrinomonadaceae bacterium]
MNREFDREIDALLRRHTRAAARGRVLEDEGSAHSPQSAHLDADELNAFAENALPAAARSLYLSHLADCGECRRAAAGLAGMSNVSIETERRAVSLKASEAAAARGGWLSALFSPRVLRYAFPALALCLVGVIAFVALRSTSPQEGMLAEQRDSEPNKGRESITQQAPTGTAPGIGTSSGATQNANASLGTGSAAANQSPQVAQPSERQAEGGEALKDATATGPAPTSPERLMIQPPAPPPAAESSRAEPVGVVTDGVSAPAPKAVSKEKTEETKLAELAAREQRSNDTFTYNQSQNQMANRAGQPRKVDIEQMPDGSRNTQRSESNNLGGGRAAENNLPSMSRQRGADNERAAPPLASRRARTPAPRDEREDDETPAEPETRSASGHRFRRQGGAWVDVKYTTSMRMTGVRRGTDGYRALVADLPELGRIAEQLPGEIIVVVKGRAYRIR